MIAQGLVEIIQLFSKVHTYLFEVFLDYCTPQGLDDYSRCKQALLYHILADRLVVKTMDFYIRKSQIQIKLYVLRNSFLIFQIVISINGQTKATISCREGITSFFLFVSISLKSAELGMKNEFNTLYRKTLFAWEIQLKLS